MDSQMSLRAASGTLPRVIVGLLGFPLGLLSMVQAGHLYEESWLLGIAIIGVSGLQVMYGMVVMMRPWETDAIGRPRTGGTRTELSWYVAGIGGKLLGVVILVLSLAGVIRHLGGIVETQAFIAMELIAIASLVTLARGAAKGR